MKGAYHFLRRQPNGVIANLGSEGTQERDLTRITQKHGSGQGRLRNDQFPTYVRSGPIASQSLSRQLPPNEFWMTRKKSLSRKRLGQR
jgi:hypothetical protein